MISKHIEITTQILREPLTPLIILIIGHLLNVHAIATITSWQKFNTTRQVVFSALLFAILVAISLHIPYGVYIGYRLLYKRTISTRSYISAKSIIRSINKYISEGEKVAPIYPLFGRRFYIKDINAIKESSKSYVRPIYIYGIFIKEKPVELSQADAKKVYNHLFKTYFNQKNSELSNLYSQNPFLK